MSETDDRPRCEATFENMRCLKRRHEIDRHVALDPPGSRDGKIVWWGIAQEPTPTPTPRPQPTGKAAARAGAQRNGFTGDACSECGSMAMVRTGTCATCRNCGRTGGCA